MKGKKSNKLFLIVATVLLAAVMILPGIGALKAKAVANYTPVAGTEMNFTKYLVIPKDANVPTLTFNYSVTYGTAVDGDADNLPIYAGNDTSRVSKVDDTKDLITVASVSFDHKDGTTDGTDTDGIANSTEKKYAEKTVKIDFSNAKYSEPGVYRYIITEGVTAGTSTAEAVRTVDVNVVDNNGSLEVSYVMYYGTLTGNQNKTTVKKDTDKKKAKATGIQTGDKCDNYVNEWPASNLYVGKKIVGNQASKDKYFKFTISLTDGGDETHIGIGGDYTRETIAANVNGATTDIPSAGYTNPQSAVTTSAGAAEIVLYLQGGQYAYLMGLPKGTAYTVTEGNYTTDGYVSTAVSATNTFEITAGTTTLTFDDATTGKIGDEDILTGFVNTKNGTIPTGVILSVAPWVIAGIVILAGVVFFAIKSRKRFEEE